MSQFSRSYKVPGVYFDPDQKRIEPITLSNKCVAGIMGFAEKGPLHTPVRITSFYEFEKIFGGFIEYGYLAYAVYGFFNSGGRECVIVRIAHSRETDRENSARKASYELHTHDHLPLCRAIARTEGTWGNITEVKIIHEAVFSTPILARADRHDWQEWIEVDSPNQFAVGDMVRMTCRDTAYYARIEKRDGSRIHFDRKCAVQFDVSTDRVSVELIALSLLIYNKKEKQFEEYYNLSPNKNNRKYFIDVVNTRSNLVFFEEIAVGGLPAEISFMNLQGGKNGILGVTPGDFIGFYKGLGDAQGMGAFEGLPDITVLAAPDVMIFEELIESDPGKARDSIFAVQRALIDQCERMENRFAILDCPRCDAFTELINWRKRFDTQVAALYYPSIQMINPADSTALTTITMPPSAHIAGVYAETDETDGIFRAPANKFIKGAVGVERVIDDEEYEVTYPLGLNCMSYISGRGTRIWGARTLSSDPEWQYINVRRTFSAIKTALRAGAGWAVFEPNNSDLRKRLIRHVNAFLLDLWRQGYMAGIEPEDGYYILCDDELNPPEEVDAGRINIEIGIAIARPAEFLVVRLTSDSENGIVLYDDEL